VNINNHRPERRGGTRKVFDGAAMGSRSLQSRRAKLAIAQIRM